MESTAISLPLRERRALLLVLSTFGFFGVVFGTWLVLLAELQATFSLSPAALGAALTTGLLVSFPVMSLSGRAVDRWGSTVVIAGSISMVGVALIGTAFAPTYALLLPFFLLFYSATAAYDVGINAAAIRFEQRSGRQVLCYFHAGFSGFAALSALVVGGVLAFGVPFRLLYLVVALFAFILYFVVWRSGVFTRERTVSSSLSTEDQGPRLYRMPVVSLLAAITALAFLSEGEMGNWVTIYLRSVLELPVLIGTSGFVVFHSAMFVGRLLGAPATRRLGRWLVLRIAGTTVAGGMLLALASERAPLILLGFLLVGLGLSVVAPTAYSLVGDAAAKQAGAASSVLTTIGYGGYLFGPVLVGGIAELAGLRLALATIVVAGGGIVFLSSLVRVWVGATPVLDPHAGAALQGAETL